MSHQFQIGDRIRSMDFKGRTDCYVEIVISVIDPERRQYGGMTMRDVCEGKDCPDSSRIGFITRCHFEGALHRDWEGRLQLVKFQLNDRVMWAGAYTGYVTGVHDDGRVTVFWDLVSPKGVANPKYGATQTTEPVGALTKEAP